MGMEVLQSKCQCTAVVLKGAPSSQLDEQLNDESNAVHDEDNLAVIAEEGRCWSSLTV